MTTITAWILMTYVSYHSGFQYSPPVATEVACEAMKKAASTRPSGSSKWDFYVCVKVEVYK